MSVLWPIVCKYTHTHAPTSVCSICRPLHRISYMNAWLFLSAGYSTTSIKQKWGTELQDARVLIFSLTYLQPFFQKTPKLMHTKRVISIRGGACKKIFTRIVWLWISAGNAKSKKFLMTLLWKMSLPSSLWCVMVLLTSMPSFSEAKRRPCDDV